MPRGLVTKPRWRPQFGLRTLLVGATIAAAILAFVAARMRTAERQAALVQQLAARGVVVYIQDSDSTWLPAAWSARLGGRVPLSAVGARIDDEALSLIGQFDGLRLLRLEASPVTDAGLIHLKRLSSVDYLDLTQTGIGDQGLASVAALTSLTTLKLGGTKVGDEGLKQLGPLTRLENLEIEGSAATYAGCLHLLVDLQGRSVLQSLAILGRAHRDATYLAELDSVGLNDTPELVPYLLRVPELRTINLGSPLPSKETIDALRTIPGLRCRWSSEAVFDEQAAAAVERLQPDEVIVRGWEWTDDRLKSLEKLSRVTELELTGSSISDAGLAHLSHLKGLTMMRVFGVRIGDEGLRHIASLKELRMLDLSGTKVTDAGLVYLNELPALEFLQLNQTQITDKGLQTLRAHPRLRGVHTDETQVSEAAREAFRTSRPDREDWGPNTYFSY